MIGSLLKSILRIVIVVFVLAEIIGITCIDWFMFHPEMVREPYDANAEGYVDLGEKGETIAAVELAATEEVGGLILEAPFLSAPRAVTKVRLLPVDPFPNAALIGLHVRCPLLILHGTDDSVIPFEQGAELARLAKQRGVCPSCRFVPVEGADHNEIASVMGLDNYLNLISGLDSLWQSELWYNLHK